MHAELMRAFEDELARIGRLLDAALLRGDWAACRAYRSRRRTVLCWRAALIVSSARLQGHIRRPRREAVHVG